MGAFRTRLDVLLLYTRPDRTSAIDDLPAVQTTGAFHIAWSNIHIKILLPTLADTFPLEETGHILIKGRTQVATIPATGNNGPLQTKLEYIPALGEEIDQPSKDGEHTKHPPEDF